MIILERFKEFIYDKSRTVLVYGGAGSGKSYSVSQKLLLRLLENSGERILVIRKIARTLKTSVYDLFIKIINDENLSSNFSCTTSPMEITCKDTGSKLIFIGLDDSEKIKSILATSIWVEEATELDFNDYLQLDLRLRGDTPSYKQFILTFNPISTNSFLFKRFFSADRNLEAKIYKSTWRDNPFLDETYVTRLSELMNIDDNYFRVYSEAEWGTLSKAIVFSKWRIWNKERDKDISLDVFDYKKRSAGLDFGFTHAAVCLVIGILEDKLVVLKEVYEKGKTNKEFIDTINQAGIPKDILFIGDSAEPNRIKEFRLNGFNILGVKKGKNSVRYQLDFLKRYEIIIAPSCVHTISEIADYSYVTNDKTGEIFDIPDPKNIDDTIAAARYAVSMFLPRKDNSLKAVPALC